MPIALRYDGIGGVRSSAERGRRAAMYNFDKVPSCQGQRTFQKYQRKKKKVGNERVNGGASTFWEELSNSRLQTLRSIFIEGGAGGLKRPSETFDLRLTCT